MKKLFAGIVGTLLTVSLLAGCNGASSSSSSGTSSTTAAGSSASGEALSGTIKMSGSTSMEKVAKALNGAFKAANSGVTIDLQLGGSSVGITDATSGKVDIGNSSRKLKDTETGLTGNVIALDGIAVVINPANTIKGLTMDQIKKIYTGETTNWKDVGGNDEPIVVIGRESSSGTRDGFESIVDVKEKCKYAQELTETGAVINAVAQGVGAIGYASLDSVDETVVAVKVDDVAANEETVKDGTYKLQRPFIMAVKEDSTNELVKAYLEFIKSEAGQAEIVKAGLVPVK